MQAPDATADHYRRQAEELRSLLQSIPVDSRRRELLELAAEWDRLARFVDRPERSTDAAVANVTPMPQSDEAPVSNQG